MPDANGFAAVGDMAIGHTTTGDPIVGYVVKMHTYPSITVWTSPGRGVCVDLATAVILR